MQILQPNRRLVLAAAAASILPLREAAAQTAAAGGDWLAMIQAHHALVAKSFDKLLASGKSTYMTREQLVKTIGYQLTAHSVAEENVIYPAIAMNGTMSDADKLYLDQAHAKVMNAQLEMQAEMKDKGNWMDAARSLQTAVLRHAKDDEEGRIYPALKAKLEPAMNQMLSVKYKREFDSVKLTRAVA
jgi:hemerythrin superfamily protein